MHSVGTAAWKILISALILVSVWKTYNLELYRSEWLQTQATSTSSPIPLGSCRNGPLEKWWGRGGGREWRGIFCLHDSCPLPFGLKEFFCHQFWHLPQVGITFRSICLAQSLSSLHHFSHGLYFTWISSIFLSRPSPQYIWCSNYFSTWDFNQFHYE